MSTLVQPSLFPPPETWPTTPPSCAVTAPLRLADFPLLPRRADGWYFATPFPGWTECGPYKSRGEALEARGSFLGNWAGNFPPRKVCTGQPRRQAGHKRRRRAKR